MEHSLQGGRALETREYNIDHPANRDFRRDLKYHADQCEILTRLAKQRDQRGLPETWSSHPRNAWMCLGSMRSMGIGQL